MAAILGDPTRSDARGAAYDTGALPSSPCTPAPAHSEPIACMLRDAHVFACSPGRSSPQKLTFPSVPAQIQEGASATTPKWDLRRLEPLRSAPVMPGSVARASCEWCRGYRGSLSVLTAPFPPVFLQAKYSSAMGAGPGAVNFAFAFCRVRVPDVPKGRARPLARPGPWLLLRVVPWAPRSPLGTHGTISSLGHTGMDCKVAGGLVSSC